MSYYKKWKAPEPKRINYGSKLNTTEAKRRANCPVCWGTGLVMIKDKSNQKWAMGCDKGCDPGWPLPKYSDNHKVQKYPPQYGIGRARDVNKFLEWVKKSVDYWQGK